MQFKLNRFICKYNKLLIVFGLFFIALFVCMISPLNPFSGDNPETDSSIFLTGARLFLQSKIPYVDFYEYKPPLIFLIDALGLFIGGFVGVWLLELISMSVSVFFAYRIARFFAGKLASLLGTIFSFVILTIFFAESNMTEEYVLPFIFVSFYIFTKYFFTKNKISIYQSVALGFCFAASLLLRPNMFAVWAGFMPVICIQFVMSKKFKECLSMCIFFLLGMFIVICPIFLYFYFVGALAECIHQGILLNFTYISYDLSGSKSNLLASVIWVCKQPFFWLPLLIFIVPFANNKCKRYGFYIAYLIFFVGTVLLIAISDRPFVHYNMLIVPLFVPVLSFYVEKFYCLVKNQNSWLVKYILPLVMLCVMFLPQISFAMHLIYARLTSNSRAKITAIGKMIDKNTNENDTITVMGLNDVFYLFTKRQSASKYTHQSVMGELVPKIASEYANDILSRKPAIIITVDHYLAVMNKSNSNYLKRSYAIITEMINKEYYPIYNEGYTVIFKRRD